MAVQDAEQISYNVSVEETNDYASYKGTYVNSNEATVSLANRETDINRANNASFSVAVGNAHEARNAYTDASADVAAIHANAYPASIFGVPDGVAVRKP